MNKELSFIEQCIQERREYYIKKGNEARKIMDAPQPPNDMSDAIKALRHIRWHAAYSWSKVDASEYPDELTKEAHLATARDYLLLIDMCNKGLGENIDDIDEVIKTYPEH